MAMSNKQKPQMGAKKYSQKNPTPGTSAGSKLLL